ncbi:Hypothetical_protein [Hexamita inflata]|uniref:Hypothetical_protein n=1 Tax=Hexamita inflata TaxID=28002 RepID=A0AA86RBP5_9EUKA|nr:Hypothetical protein HINF_LOCUS59353 [Hexamita inflata]
MEFYKPSARTGKSPNLISTIFDPVVPYRRMSLPQEIDHIKLGEYAPPDKQRNRINPADNDFFSADSSVKQSLKQREPGVLDKEPINRVIYPNNRAPATIALIQNFDESRYQRDKVTVNLQPKTQITVKWDPLQPQIQNNGNKSQLSNYETFQPYSKKYALKYEYDGMKPDSSKAQYSVKKMQ